MLLDIRNLSVQIDDTPVLESVSLQLQAGQILGIAVESGSGKTMSALAIAGLLPRGAQSRGDIRLNGQDLTDVDEATFCSVRGKEVGIVFQ